MADPIQPPASPPPVPPASASPVTASQPISTDDLSKKLDDLAESVKKLAQSGGCYADIESQIANARTQLANGKPADAQATYDQAAAIVCRAEVSARAEPLAWKLLWTEAGYLFLILALGYLVKRYPDYWLWNGLVGLGARAAWFGAV